jgi:hypothetical protein
MSTKEQALFPVQTYVYSKDSVEQKPNYDDRSKDCAEFRDTERLRQEEDDEDAA